MLPARHQWEHNAFRWLSDQSAIEFGLLSCGITAGWYTSPNDHQLMPNGFSSIVFATGFVADVTPPIVQQPNDATRSPPSAPQRQQLQRHGVRSIRESAVCLYGGLSRMHTATSSDREKTKRFPVNPIVRLAPLHSSYDRLLSTTRALSFNSSECKCD